MADGLEDGGFLQMSHKADELLSRETNQSSSTDQPARGIERLLIDEVKARPIKTLAWAATAGLVVGVWLAR